MNFWSMTLPCASRVSNPSVARIAPEEQRVLKADKKAIASETGGPLFNSDEGTGILSASIKPNRGYLPKLRGESKMNISPPNLHMATSDMGTTGKNSIQQCTAPAHFLIRDLRELQLVSSWCTFMMRI
ncbi:hypothetical protein PUNSTDRAFT_118958 [Punctularia strigosozonata HHB-11173 SS5]|uniref:uncharacterized protein n=1 Tax=Punctularia strigosozonata (strain HHB-11173) TaxID=741275 RepID=UPI00044185CD|nr:uncharacterized protein PUNSTDRAFT_118958 [Punctularia strigosozonata HHB-11173 SS5]EIN11665.1 hypothetical protein PUNSTDRAFT_118958 [Punctularia strigosozonata HHB-11173 SS5]